MKNNALLFVSLVAIFVSSCSTVKNTKTTDNLSSATWELEYISGTRIAFEGLYPNKKPQITFNTTTNEVNGTSSCNGYMAKYTSNGKTISFGEPGPTTMMFCEGGGEQRFLQMIKKVDNYSIDNDGKLNLNIGEVPMMRFKKSKN
ncbi:MULTISPECIES: META domain-containing protein [unclassified Mucilaginibacter]|uniref:META domain-containing protein n=1 Tax=unclassified Mucilaginibacter TaxID=2617802 RepID=UPI002AC9207A|nr:MULTISPECIES: META domain-containing protein [unclassified Mucilaginibacter]MEB0260690.1 META domain-containing protein [Mucilaginibacter sp. 10I4]MEB0280638.1 META domain-containing protein [Mucilaginibacter sp. 10B2]MEB0300950.1 META domain-containing protein [Mucilaginibacter sp. 5C4]WPX24945.1 META domain-containing protein [Mucilaginibacter sp. 5C4]